MEDSLKTIVLASNPFPYSYNHGLEEDEITYLGP